MALQPKFNDLSKPDNSSTPPEEMTEDTVPPTIIPSELLPESDAVSGDKVTMTVTGTVQDDGGIEVETVDSVVADGTAPKEPTETASDTSKPIKRGVVRSPAEALYGAGN